MTDALAPLVAEFRVALNAFKGIDTEPDAGSGREEIADFLKEGYPVFALVSGGETIGYIVCRTEGYCIWVEQLFVKKEYRRQGAASMLFGKAEELAASKGEDTLYNYVHPNNDAVIGFLRSRGYTVLNLIEIRKPYGGEIPKSKIKVAENEFDY